MEEVRFCQRCGSSLRPQMREGRMRPVCGNCGAVVFFDPKVVAGVIIPIEGKIVMIRRSMEPGLGRWTFPAGFVDRGEAVEAAAVREAREETGLEVELTRLVGVYSRSGDVNILVVYEGRVVGGTLLAGDEAQEAGLFPLDGLPPLAFVRDEGIIREWREHTT
ncbi:MAG: NUDIX hydrolase [Chloroflexi bacterium]|nr:NUDIX hydrolase [Chloroflexota bacterium]